MKKINEKLIVKFSFLILNLVIFQSMFAQPANRNLDIYLLIGQSNMGGRGPITPEVEGIIPGVWVFRGQDDWVEGQNPMNVYSTIQPGVINKVNPGYGFSIKMKTLRPDHEIGIVSNARGATGLQEWMPGTTYYNEAVQRALLAMQYGTIKGILWHQGEEDTKDPNNIPLYLDRIETLINSLRADLGDLSLPFIAGQISREPTSYQSFNQMILDFPGILPNTELVSSEGLTNIGDGVHFDTASQIVLGERYADKMFSLVSTTTGGRPTINFDLPITDSVITEGETPTVVVSATDANGTVSKVDLFINNNLVRSDTEAPYQWDGSDFVLQNLTPGYYTLKAIATDNDGEQGVKTRRFSVVGNASTIPVKVTGTGFEKRTFANGSVFFTNRTYTILNAPTTFTGFDFLASNGREANPGVITPLADGFVYIAAPGSGVAGWELVPNANFNYNDGTQTSVSIYKKAAIANIPIDIPQITAFSGASVIAKTITLETLGINAFDQDESLVIYPNPVREGSFNIKLKSMEIADVSIYDLDGRLLYNRKNLHDNLNIKIPSNFIPGFYIVKTTTESGKLFTKKILVK
jgi:hypothetical protein